MSQRCPECHRVNDDSRKFCTNCGATLDPHLRLIQDLERQKEAPSKKQPERKEEMSFYVTRSAPKEKKKSAAPWIILGLIVVVAVLWFFLH